MEKRSAMAMMLIFMLWMGYFLVFAPKPRPKQIPQAGDSLTVTTVEKTAPQAAEKGEILLEVAGEAAISRPDTSTVPVDTIVVSSDLYEYHFITRGGVLTRAWLKEYPAFDSLGAKGSDLGIPVQLIPERESLFLYTRLHLKNSEKPIDLGNRNFTASLESLRLGRTKEEGKLTFTHQLPGGSELKLVYTLRNDSYLIKAGLYLPEQLHGPKENTVEVLLGPSLVSNEKNRKEDYSDYGIIYYDNGEVVKKSLGDLTKSDWAPTGERKILWGGVKSKYFMSTFFVPDDPMVGMSASGNEESKALNFAGLFPIPAEIKAINYSIYVGPQSYKQITRLNFGLQKVLQYGWSIIQPFSKISLEVLLWLHKWIKNYALIIVIFSILVKVVFYPLTIKSTKSQIKMQQIQPLVNDLRKRYKDDPKKLQEETLRLYKVHKVNPLGGCLPLLVQMPVLFALFYVFQRTIEFRGAEAFGWIHDLSQPDPFYILPVTMGATTFLQQKLTPTQTDPKMAPMMYIMPFFMTFIFLRFSSGLVLYYTFFNIFQIVQQLYINKRYHAPKPAIAAGVQKPEKKAEKAPVFPKGKRKGSSGKK
ncbi:MAG TPA: membrane protein insertase YidC [archaeon]|nr:membrane protein insertase YidC [archaeon]